MCLRYPEATQFLEECIERTDGDVPSATPFGRLFTPVSSSSALADGGGVPEHPSETARITVKGAES